MSDQLLHIHVYFCLYLVSVFQLLYVPVILRTQTHLLILFLAHQLLPLHSLLTHLFAFLFQLCSQS